MMETRRIREYFDFGCPFCYNAWNFMKQIRPKVSLEEEFYGWEIHPDVPPQGKTLTLPKGEETREQLNRLGEPVGVTPGDMTKVFNTNKALQLVEEAKKQGIVVEYMDAVYHAYWVEKRNVGVDSILLGIADQVGLANAKEVLENDTYRDVLAEHDAHCAEIELEFVPSFEEDGTIILSGVLSLEDVEAEFCAP